MGKARRAEKKARKEDRSLEAEDTVRQIKAARRRRIVLLVVPVVTLAAAAVCLWEFDLAQVAGAVMLGGFVVWLMLLLGFLGSSIPPRGRSRAGSIDFGSRR